METLETSRSKLEYDLSSLVRVDHHHLEVRALETSVVVKSKPNLNESTVFNPRKLLHSAAQVRRASGRRNLGSQHDSSRAKYEDFYGSLSRVFKKYQIVHNSHWNVRTLGTNRSMALL